jgi:poly-gamma-glutamate capsule biosynthesis protein CapA/YwtB (metallophosphatase superfamily)
MKRATCLLGALLSVGVTEVAAQNRVGDGAFELALTGDAIITRRLSVYNEPAFLALIERLRAADASFTNLEMLFHDYEPAPAHESGGTYMRAEPALLQELVWAGIDFVSLANNHTGDYGAEGMRITRRHVDAAGLVSAGAGEDLPEAREARFLDTADGRVALISVASTFPEHSAAGPPRGSVRGRPGLSPLRHTRTRVVEREHLERMRALLRDMGQSVPEQGERLSVFGTALVAGAEAGTRTAPDSADVHEIAEVVRNAAGLADYVVVSIHAHESAGRNSVPADFVVAFAHAAIDAGADVFVGHGPHVLRGIEIYRGKPIFYSLGDFIFQNETLLRLPHDNYAPYDLDANAGVTDFNDARYRNDTRGFPTQREIWESVVAVPRWRGDALQSIELIPITLGFGKPRTERGRPLLADPQLGRKIIDDLIERSRPFGTTIEWRDGIGVVVLGTGATER